MILYDWHLKIKPKSFFEEMEKLDVPWKDFNNLLNLDTLYFEVHAKNLIASSWAENIDVENAVNVVYSTYINNWNKLWQNYIAEYNPIENYSMIEELTGKKTTTFDSDLVKEENISNNITSDVTSNNSSTSNATGSTTTNSDTSIYTFNTQNGTKSDSGVTTSTPNLTNTSEDDNISNTITNITNKISSTSTTNNNGVEDNTHNLKRSGNIGVTTSAQMIAENIELWKWNYFEQIFNDIDKIMSIGVYDYDN